MRLVASFEEEQKAYILYSLLLKADIEAIYEVIEDPSSKRIKYPVWVIREEDFEKALEIHEEFETHAESYLKENTESLKTTEELKARAPIKVHAISPFVTVRPRAPLTRLIIIICIMIFLWNGYQKALLVKEAPELMKYFGLTTLVMNLMYDTPDVFEQMYQFLIKHPTLKIEEMDTWNPLIRKEFKKLDKEPYWKGVYHLVTQWPQSKPLLQTSLFTKIREGEIWRVITPAVLHANFLHILFNMLWLWLLGKEVESKIGKLRYLALMILIGVVSNTMQYLMSGPLFLGYSGIICGLGGFIWVRQKLAPWEGYNIPLATLLFLFIFIVGMLLLQIVALVMSKMHLGDFPIGNIGNTAHLTGLVCGMILARIPTFYRLTS
jgi:GlpG protein